MAILGAVVADRGADVEDRTVDVMLRVAAQCEGGGVLLLTRHVVAGPLQGIERALQAAVVVEARSVSASKQL